MTTFKGRGLVQLTGKDMNTLLKQSTTTNMTLGTAKMAIGQGVYAEAGYAQKIRPSKKISLTIYEANGGHVIEVDGDQYGQESELYIVGEEKNIGEEIGKIITHNKLKT